MNTFVPKYMRQLERSGFVTEAGKRAVAAATSAATKVARAACPECGNLYARGAGITNHMRACKRTTAPEHVKYSQLPDFTHNFDFVTTRRFRPEK